MFEESKYLPSILTIVLLKTDSLNQEKNVSSNTLR